MLTVETSYRVEPITHIPPTQSRTLVGVYIDLSYSNKKIIAIYNKKIRQYIHTLQIYNLSPMEVYKGYFYFW